MTRDDRILKLLSLGNQAYRNLTLTERRPSPAFACSVGLDGKGQCDVGWNYSATLSISVGDGTGVSTFKATRPEVEALAAALMAWLDASKSTMGVVRGLNKHERKRQRNRCLQAKTESEKEST